MDNPLRNRNGIVNALLPSKICDLSGVQLLNTDCGFIQPDGTISHLDMYDYLHLSPRGYRKVFEPVHDLLVQLLATESEQEDVSSQSETPHHAPEH